MSDDLTEEEQILSSKALVAKEKTLAMKKGLAAEKNLIAAKKKDLLSKQMLPPVELTKFLHSDETFDKILEIAHKDVHDINVRR